MSALNKPRLILMALLVGGALAAQAANLGPDDQQVSTTGPAGTVATDAVSPAVAYATGQGRYLLVWSADEVDGEFRIYGRLLTGAGGVPIGPQFQAAPAAPAGTDQRQPAVAYDPVRQQFLVVWSGDEANPGAFEISGQLISLDGRLVGPAVRLSDMGTNDSDAAFDAVTPDVAWQAGVGSFVVVWAGDDDTGALSDGRFEIYGQLVTSAGAETGDNDFRISFAGNDANGNDAMRPAVVAVPGLNRWFVAFEGDVTDDGVHIPEIFVYGGSGSIPDALAFAVSIMGGSYFDDFGARNPDVAWSASQGELVFVWDGDQSGSPHGVYGQRLLPDGTAVGGMLALSAVTAPGGTALREAIRPAIAVDPLTSEWFVAWQGSPNVAAVYFNHEIWAARFDDTGSPVLPDAIQLSNMDPALVPVAGAGPPALAINTEFGSKLLAWSGDLFPTPGDGREIYSQAWTNDAVSAVDDLPVATDFALHGATPNPFNPMTKIAFDLPAAAPVTLRVYDMSGRLVRTLMNGEMGLVGANSVVWNGLDERGRQSASGVYLYRLETPSDQAQGRMTLVK